MGWTVWKRSPRIFDPGANARAGSGWSAWEQTAFGASMAGNGGGRLRP